MCGTLNTSTGRSCSLLSADSSSTSTPGQLPCLIQYVCFTGRKGEGAGAAEGLEKLYGGEVYYPRIVMLHWIGVKKIGNTQNHT